MATEWAREYRSLKQKIVTMDKDVFKLLTFTKTTTLKNEIQGLIDFEEKKEFERHLETEELHTFISSLRKDLFNLKQNIKNYSKNPANLSKIQEITEKIEEKMSKFKEKQMVNFDNILDEEATLSHEIDLISQKLEQYEAPVQVTEPLNMKSRPARGVSSHRRPAETLLQPVNVGDEEEKENGVYVTDVRANRGVVSMDQGRVFKEQIDQINNEIVQLGGNKAFGWDHEDHQMFLKIRTKHKNNIDKIAFLNDCITSLPFYGEVQIEEHIEKFKKYLELEDKKKQLTKEYKENKENEKKNMVELLRQEDQKKEEQTRVKLAVLHKTQEEREKERQKLKEWRASKIARMEVTSDNVKQTDIMKKKEREAVDRVKKEEAQKRIQEYKEKKELEKIREKEREEYKKSLQKRRLDKEEIERLKEREDHLMKKNFEKLAMKKKAEQEKEARTKRLMEANTYAFGHVESKLTEETKAIGGKKREKFDPKKDTGRMGDNFGGSLVRNAGRAIPMWRQGLS